MTAVELVQSELTKLRLNRSVSWFTLSQMQPKHPKSCNHRTEYHYNFFSSQHHTANQPALMWAQLQDIWVGVIGPHMHARDIIALSGACRWGRHTAHRIRSHQGLIGVRDESDELLSLQRAMQSWPQFQFQFRFNPTSSSYRDLPRHELFDLISRVNFLWLGTFKFRSWMEGANCNIQHLRIEDGNLEQDGPKMFVQFLKDTSSLRRLDLWNIKGPGFALEEGLRYNLTIQTLEISRCFVNEPPLYLCAFEFNTSVTHLSLHHVGIGNRYTMLIRDLLQANTTITSLDITYNSIQDSDCRALVEGLSQNTTLKSLNLAHNRISTGGSRLLSVCLLSNSSLTSLDLSYNVTIGNEGLQTLLRGLEMNTTLTEMDVEFFGDFDIKHAIHDALNRNKLLAQMV
eukprot:c928_g1_i1.p1 GENE.c928_g1_i1~~c928_g1_i1.p1  ORF type:complete len:400 (+),score=77.78 c928_g1_i1:106-1305(+)